MPSQRFYLELLFTSASRHQCSMVFRFGLSQGAISAENPGYEIGWELDKIDNIIGETIVNRGDGLETH